jgi:hypothetical protein
MHGQILEEFGGGRIGIGRFVDTWDASFGGLGEAGLAAMALAALAGLLGNRLVGSSADGEGRLDVGDLRGGLVEWRWGLGGSAVVMGFLSLRCCLRRWLPATLEAGWRSGVGGLAAVMAFLRVRRCLQRRVPASPVASA